MGGRIPKTRNRRPEYTYSIYLGDYVHTYIVVVGR